MLTPFGESVSLALKDLKCSKLNPKLRALYVLDVCYRKSLNMQTK